MSISMTVPAYVAYLNKAAAEIERNKDYITALDSKTGDGDHWVNLNMGFQKVISLSAELEGMTLPAMLKKVGMTMMSAVGGSSGVLYGGAYMASAKAAEGHDLIDDALLLAILDAQLQSIMDRGKAQPGYKTMLDSLHQGIEAYRAALDSNADSNTALQALKKGAEDGAEATKNMEAVKGRASYQTNKGVGDLDPGAVTMAMQLQCLADYISENCL